MHYRPNTVDITMNVTEIVRQGGFDNDHGPTENGLSTKRKYTRVSLFPTDEVFTVI